MSYLKRLAITALIASGQFYGCQPDKANVSSLDTYAVSPSEWSVLEAWNGLENRQTFRLSVSSSKSRCFLPGSNGLSEQECGTFADWKIRRNVTESGAIDSVKMIESIYGEICIAIGAKGENKKGPILAYTTPCNDNDQSQWLTLLDSSRIVRLEQGTSKLVEPTNIKSVSLFTAGYKPDYLQDIDPSALVVAGPTKGSNDIASKDVYAVRSSVYWGHMPAITRIAIAFDDSGSFVRAIEITRFGGKQEILGSCEIIEGRCRLQRSEHAIDLGRKWQVLENAAILISGDKISGIKLRLVEKNNPTTPTEMEILGSSAEREATTWEWLDDADSSSDTAHNLSNFAERAIAGFVAHTKGLDSIAEKNNLWWKDRSKEPSYLKALSAIYVNKKSYFAHNPDLFAAENSGQSFHIAFNSDQVIGLKDSEKSLKRLEKIDGHYRHIIKNLHDFFYSNKSFQFNTAFASNEFESKHIGRIYICGKTYLKSLYVLPKDVSETGDTEWLGATSCPSQKILTLDEDEYITRVWWKPIEIEEIKLGPIKPFDIRPSPRDYLTGQRIGGLRFDTNKTKAKIFFESDLIADKAKNWILGFEKPGYAISGFYGLGNPGEDPEKIDDLKTTQDGIAYLLHVKGIAQLRPIFKKIDSRLQPPQNTDPNIYQSQLFGGSEGQNFDPSYWLSTQDQIKTISIWQQENPAGGMLNQSSYIHGLGITYKNQKNIVNGIQLGKKVSLNLADGEFITKLDIYTGNAPLQIPEANAEVVLGISLTTSQNRIFKAGLPTDERITRAHNIHTIDLNGETLLGFYGTTVGKGLGKLGIIFKH